MVVSKVLWLVKRGTLEMRVVDVSWELSGRKNEGDRNVNCLYQRTLSSLLTDDDFPCPHPHEGLSSQRIFELYSALSHS